MRLIIIRHAIAAARGTPGIPEAERPLTPEGEGRFEQAARGLAHILPPPHAILTSPLLRARRTAEIAAEAWGGPDPVDEGALADGDPEALSEALAPYPADAAVALIGHEPHVSDLLASLIGAESGGPLAFKKGGVACVEIEGPLEKGGRLRWFMPPKVLRKLAALRSSQ